MLKPLFMLGLLPAIWLIGCSAAKVPEPPSSTSSTGKDGDVKLGKSETKSGSKSSTETSEEESSTSDEESESGSEGAAQGSSNGDDDLAQVKKNADKCQKDGYYYRARDRICDKSQKAIPASDLKECTNAYVLGTESKFLSEGNKKQLKGLFNDRLAGFQLKFCLQGDAQNYKFVAWKESDGEITTQELLIPKKT